MTSTFAVSVTRKESDGTGLRSLPSQIGPGLPRGQDTSVGTGQARQRKIVLRAIKRHSYCVLATSSASNRPHVAGVLYSVVDGDLFVATLARSVKVRNAMENARVAVCIPVRRFPVGPPFAVQFQGKAEVLALEAPPVAGALEAGRLRRITSHGELEHPDTCILRIARGPRIATYGLGVPLLKLLRDPLGGSNSVDLGLGRE